MHIRIMTIDEGPQLVADLPNWDEPYLPNVGEYFFHPPLSTDEQGVEDLHQIAGCVKSKTWRMYERPSADNPAGDLGGFAPTAHPYLEIHI